MEDMQKSTVMVETKITGVMAHSQEKQVVGGHGSGVVYGDKFTLDDGTVVSRVLTAAHVVEQPAIGGLLPVPDVDDDLMVVTETDVMVRSWNGEECLTIVAAYEPKLDLATLLVNCDLPSATIATINPQIGSRLLATGFPRRWGVMMITEGFWSGVRADPAHEVRELAVTSVPVAPGSSGGPLWYHGQVVGIARGIDSQFEHMSLFVPANEIQELMESAP